MELLNRRQILIVAIAALVALMMGCAATRPKDSDAVAEEDFSIEELLNEPNAEDAQTQQASASKDDEAEVLRLLGITKEDQQTTESTQTLSQQEQAEAGGQQTTTSPITGDYETQIATLQKEIEDKDHVISSLKSDLAEKEVRVQQLENSLSQPKVTAGGSVSEASASYETRYKTALDTYQKRQYRQAITLFEALINEDSGNSLSDNCQYWIGECYYGLKDYDQGIIEFQKVFAYPNSNKADDAQLKLGFCYVRMGDKVRAKEEFQRVVIDYPKSEYKNTAQTWVNKL